VETDVNTTTRKTKEQMERIGLAASRISISGNYMLGRPKRLKDKAVAPKEEELTRYIDLLNLHGYRTFLNHIAYRSIDIK
jgi:hypothetical protein